MTSKKSGKVKSLLLLLCYEKGLMDTYLSYKAAAVGKFYLLKHSQRPTVRIPLTEEIQLFMFTFFFNNMHQLYMSLFNVVFTVVLIVDV